MPAAWPRNLFGDATRVTWYTHTHRAQCTRTALTDFHSLLTQSVIVIVSVVVPYILACQVKVTVGDSILQVIGFIHSECQETPGLFFIDSTFTLRIIYDSVFENH